jgi:nucleoside-diphosphate-sugar epimerase
MNVLVTGGTGFVGLNLVPLLGSRGHQIRVLVRQQSPVGRLPDSAETVRGDVLAPSTLDPALSGIDGVVHLAARFTGDREAVASVNVHGTEALLERAVDQDVSTFVFCSTAHAHPEIPIPDPSPYERTKASADRRIRDRDPPLDYAVVYPTYAVGPRDYRLSQHGYFRLVRSNALLVPPLYPPNRYNIVHVADVARSLLYCLEEGAGGRHIVSGPNLSSVAFHRKIAAVVDGRHGVVPFPTALYRRVIGPLVDWLHDKGLSPVPGDRFREVNHIGTVPEEYANRAPVPQTSVEQALRDAYAWYDDVGVL